MSFYFDDEAKREARRKRQKFIRERRESGLRKILETEEGREYFWNLLGEAGVFRSSFYSGSDNPESLVFFNEGKRDMGLLILTEIFQVEPGAFNLMQREAAWRIEQEKKFNESISQSDTE